MPSDWFEIIKSSDRLPSSPMRITPDSVHKINKIRESRYSNQIDYRDAPYVFKHVSELYPQVDLKSAEIIRAPFALIEDAGYYGMGGFYDINSRTVVVSDSMPVGDFSSESIPFDVTLAHELIHYASCFKYPPMSIIEEEKLAYLGSMNLLYKHGKSFQWIVDNYLISFFMLLIPKSKAAESILLDIYGLNFIIDSTLEMLLNMINREENNIQKLWISMCKEEGMNLFHDNILNFRIPNISLNHF